ncbi:MAG: Lrp/AsnC family transcriptional regulator [Deltaproteobacteria bacterium]|nr:Lrp/AsnC family transcriptional regulator [Deltaproteobacteria bacterium]
MIDEIDKKIIRMIQGDIPLISRPFALLADEIKISEDEMLGRIQSLIHRGILRRFGATLRHQEAGFSSNAMVAWNVPDDRAEAIGLEMGTFREVTHCYLRERQKEWNFNLYTMIHGETREECHRIADRISEICGIKDYEMLFSENEFKKTSMEYF